MPKFIPMDFFVFVIESQTDPFSGFISNDESEIDTCGIVVDWVFALTHDIEFRA